MVGEIRTARVDLGMIHFFIGTKAQFIKTAPVILAVEELGVPYRLIDSGQHAEFSTAHREALGLRPPEITMAAGGGDIASMRQAVKWLGIAVFRWMVRPRWIKREVFGGFSGICVVHGDTASTLIATLFARRAGLDVAHLEAGLRSGSYLNPFPEEMIRVICMHLSSVLFAPDDEAVQNLASMKLSDRVVLTHGNTVRDALKIAVEQGSGDGEEPRSYVLAACHRLETIRSSRMLAAAVDCINRVASEHRVVFPLHRPTEKALRATGLRKRLRPSIECLPMQEYREFVTLMKDAHFVIADGGSIQEECALLGVPLLILRDRTERSDGLDSNAMLAKFDLSRVEYFMQNSERFRSPESLSGESPSREVARHLVEWCRQRDLLAPSEAPA